MPKNDEIKRVIEMHYTAKVLSVTPAGKGASGAVYCAEIDRQPYKIAVKVGSDFSMLESEKNMLDFLSARVSFKVPETYFICSEGGQSFLAMEFIEGKSGANIKFIKNKKHLAESILSAFMNMQSVTNEKFGKYDNPEFDAWQEYYRAFFNEIYDFSKSKNQAGELDDVVITALELISQNFDVIFNDISSPAVLCHGDFWLPNMLIDTKKCELAGVLDPFDMLWAEREYELFCFTVTDEGKKLGLYELYKSRNKVSQYCDLKVELYALCNELHWYKRLGTIGHDYLIYRSRNLIKGMEKLF